MLYAIDFIKRLKNKDITYLDIFSICIVGFLGVFYIGALINKVSWYYMIKIYFIFWMVIFGITIDLVNRYIDTKILKWIIPIYVLAWTTFVCGWVWIKAGHILGEEEKHALPNYVGMYYLENCEHRKAYDLIHNFTSDNIAITEYARENLEDMTADNTVLFTESFYRTIWAMATLEYTGEKYDFRHILNTTNQYNIKDSVKSSRIKYMIRLDPPEQGKLKEGKEALESLKEYSNVEVLYSNESGFVAKINK